MSDITDTATDTTTATAVDPSPNPSDPAPQPDTPLSSSIDSKGRFCGFPPSVTPTALRDLKRAVELGLDIPQAVAERGVEGPSLKVVVQKYQSNPDWVRLLREELEQAGLMVQSVKVLKEALGACVVTVYKGVATQTDIPDHAIRARVAKGVLDTVANLAVSAQDYGAAGSLRRMANDLCNNWPPAMIEFVIANERFPSPKELVTLLGDGDGDGAVEVVEEAAANEGEGEIGTPESI